jgi:transposase-like protein
MYLLQYQRQNLVFKISLLQRQQLILEYAVCQHSFRLKKREKETMKYTEKFKRQVVKKILSRELTAQQIEKKLRIGHCAITRWKKQYSSEFLLRVDDVPHEKEEIDIDQLLRNVDEISGQETICPDHSHPELIMQKNKSTDHYTMQEKYSLIQHYRTLSGEDSGLFLRTYRLRSQHITLWEEEILAMGKNQIDKDEYIHQLEAENKTLLKQVKGLERDNHELKVIIEIKKKYPELFGRDEEPVSSQEPNKCC